VQTRLDVIPAGSFAFDALVGTPGTVTFRAPGHPDQTLDLAKLHARAVEGRVEVRM
jgi:hypothetical protein